MSAIGLYYLNGADMYSTYGFAPAPGASDSFLEWWERREPYYNEWEEDHGKEYDLIAPPVYENRTFSLSGYIICSSEDDFRIKYSALFSAFNTTGSKTLLISEFGQSYEVFYSKMSNLQRKTRIKDTDLIAVSIEIELIEVLGDVLTLLPPPEGENIPEFTLYSEGEPLTSEGNYIISY